jgi:hypothetical protein
VVVKYASKRSGEADILRRLSSSALLEDPRNCTVPILDILRAGSLDREHCLIVMKKGRDSWYEPEVMQDTDWRPFFGQISEVRSSFTPSITQI